MRRRGVGFTLVELLVVLMMTVLLVTSAAAFMRVMAGAREVTDTRLQGEQEASVALRTITSALRNAYRPVTDSDILFEGISEGGGGDPVPRCRVRFRCIDRRVIRSGQPESDVHELEFFIRDDGVKPMLMRRSDPTKNPDPDGGGVVEPLAADVVGLDVQYFDGEKWLDRWLETRKKWPVAVNVRLIYRDDSTPASTKLGAISSIVSFPHWETGQTTTGDQDDNGGATQQPQQ